MWSLISKKDKNLPERGMEEPGDFCREKECFVS
jgi:hypothetical protein